VPSLLPLELLSSSRLLAAAQILQDMRSFLSTGITLYLLPPPFLVPRDPPSYIGEIVPSVSLPSSF